MTSVRRFPGSVASVREARRFVSECAGDVPPTVLDALLFVVSELATNSVVHASTDFTITVEHERDRVRVEVTDEGGGDPVVRSPDANDVRGRGLLIVSELSDDWGVVPSRDGQGKSVWFAMQTGVVNGDLSRSGV